MNIKDVMIGSYKCTNCDFYGCFPIIGFNGDWLRGKLISAKPYTKCPNCSNILDLDLLMEANEGAD